MQHESLAKQCQQFQNSCRQGNVKWINMQKCRLAILTWEEESVNRSQMDTKRKNMWCSNLGGKTYISRHNLHQHWYTCPIALPVRRNPQHRSLLAVVSATSAPPFQHLRHQRNVCPPVVSRFMRQTLPTVNRKHFSMNILYIESFYILRVKRCSLGVQSSSRDANLTTETSLWTCACASAT
jgi:hypothetical protein